MSAYLPLFSKVMLLVLFPTSRLSSELELRSCGITEQPSHSSILGVTSVSSPLPRPFQPQPMHSWTFSWFLLYQQSLKLAYKTPFVFKGFSSQLVNTEKQNGVYKIKQAYGEVTVGGAGEGIKIFEIQQFSLDFIKLKIRPGLLLLWIWSILDAFLQVRPKNEACTKSSLGNSAGSLILTLPNLSYSLVFSLSHKLGEERVSYLIT